MSLKRQALKNVGSSWFGLAANMVIGFFMLPFILHRLGDTAFGLYLLAFSVTGYYGLFGFGVRSSVVRYVSKYVATDDRENLNRVLNTTLFMYGVVAVTLLLVSAVGAYYVDSIFRVSPAFLSSAQVLFFMIGAAIALGFPLVIFEATLEGLQKFYFINVASVATAVLRAALIIVALEHGLGLLTVAGITVGLGIVRGLAYVVAALRSLHVEWGRRFLDWATFRMTGVYGLKTFVIDIAGRLRWQSDAMIIGLFLSPAAITFYSVGSKLSNYPGRFVDGLASIFLPMASHFEALGDKNRLRQILIAGNRACSLVAFPFVVVLVILGKPIISRWVGPSYISSYTVLILLLIPLALQWAQDTSIRMLFAMERHGWLAVVRIVEGVAKISLSILLVRGLGIDGVALGTTIAMTAVSVFFLPAYACRLLDIRLSRFLAETYAAPLALCIPLVGVLLLLERIVPPADIWGLLAELSCGGIVYGAGLLWFFLTREPLGIEMRARIGHMFERAWTR